MSSGNRQGKSLALPITPLRASAAIIEIVI
jgi:hypothetical protein